MSDEPLIAAPPPTDDPAEHRTFEPRLLTPEARLRNPDQPTQGYEVPLGDGSPWVLYPFGAECWDSEVALVQDDLYDALAYDGKIPETLLYRAFEAAIRVNYDVTTGEAAVLFFGVDPEVRRPALGNTHLQLSLVQAVLAATLPSQCPTDTTYSDWLDSALRINGLKPEEIPPERLPAVLGHLVALGRAVPPERFVSAAIAGAERSKGRALAASPDHRAPDPDSA